MPRSPAKSVREVSAMALPRTMPALRSRPLVETNANTIPACCMICPVRTDSVCATLTTEELTGLSLVSSHHRAAPGEILVDEGSEADHLINIIDGTAKIYKLLGDGRRQIVGFLNPGDISSLALTSSYSTTVEAVSPIRYCVFPRSYFEYLLSGSRTLEKTVRARLVGDLIAAENHFVLLGRKAAQERIATFLLMVWEQVQPRRPDQKSLTLVMTRADIADYLGLTTETVSRSFTRLKEAGHIEVLSGGKIHLCDIDALRHLASGDHQAG